MVFSLCFLIKFSKSNASEKKFIGAGGGDSLSLLGKTLNKKWEYKKKRVFYFQFLGNKEDRKFDKVMVASFTVNKITDNTDHLSSKVKWLSRETITVDESYGQGRVQLWFTIFCHQGSSSVEDENNVSWVSCYCHFAFL